MFTGFNAVDRAIDGIPLAARLGLYGLLVGTIAMLIYWRLSPQRRIRALREQIAKAMRAQRAYTGTDLVEILKLSGQAIAPALKQVVLVLGPSLVAVLPVVLVMHWLQSTYSCRVPDAGAAIAVSVDGVSGSSSFPVSWAPASVLKELTTDGRQIITWPGQNEPVTLFDAISGQPLLRLPLSHPVTTVSRAHWWSGLLEGRDRIELPPNVTVSSVELDLPTRWVWSIGPQWMRTWHAPFMAALTVAALVIKFTMKIA